VRPALECFEDGDDGDGWRVAASAALTRSPYRELLEGPRREHRTGRRIDARLEPDAGAWSIWKLYQPIQSLQWSAHITRIGDGLTPDFALIDLERRHCATCAAAAAGQRPVVMLAGPGADTGRSRWPRDAGQQCCSYLALLAAFYVWTSLLASYRLGPIFGLLYAGMALLQMLLLWGPFPR
jgi:hypothetical protein